MDKSHPNNNHQPTPRTLISPGAVCAVRSGEIEKNDFNLNISRYISTATAEEEIDLAATHDALKEIESTIRTATAKHNEFLKELGMPRLPAGDLRSPKP